MTPDFPIAGPIRISRIAAIAFTAVAVALLLHPGVPAMGNWLFYGAGRSTMRFVEYAAHFSVFFILASLFAWQSAGWRHIAIAAAVLLAAALGMEAAQSWVPQRGVDKWDAVCNVGGAILGCLPAFVSLCATKNAATSAAS